MENAHTIDDLKQMQAAPLSVKVRMTQSRIRDWVNWFGVDGVYVSFSGGKDSTVLLHLVREMYPEVPAVFCDTGLEFPEIRDFVKTWDNVEWLKPKKTFKQIISEYGYPFISKEVAERIYYAQRYLTWYRNQNSLDRPTDRPSSYGMLDILYARKSKDREKAKKEGIPDEILRAFAESNEKGNYKIKELFGMTAKKERSAFDYTSWRWLAASPYKFSSYCCNVMKKNPSKDYAKQTGRKMISGQMACESRLRTMQWLHNGCNAFNAKKQVSNPMAFWTEQDVLMYIYKNKIPVASVYGDIVIDYEAEGQIQGQMSFRDLGGDWETFDTDLPLLKTTGYKRTGCMFCGFGCHLEKPGEGRFERLKVTHPTIYEYIFKDGIFVYAVKDRYGKTIKVNNRYKDMLVRWIEQNKNNPNFTITRQYVPGAGLGYKDVIDWLNEHGNLNIRY